MIPVKLSDKNTSKAKQNLISMNKLGLYWFPSINTTDVTPISLFLLNRETLGQEKTVDLSRSNRQIFEKFITLYSLRKKCPKLFWSLFSRIRTECGPE